jgi:hypothetical protein
MSAAQRRVVLQRDETADVQLSQESRQNHGADSAAAFNDPDPGSVNDLVADRNQTGGTHRARGPRKVAALYQ